MNIGIIGGADGPTAIFITAGENWYIVPVVLAVLAVCIILLIRRKRRR